MADTYDPDDLQRISDIQNVRERPAMYLGDLHALTASNCLAREAYCLAIDEIVAGTCTQLTTEFTSDGFACVTHNGTALGVEPGWKLEMSQMQVVAELIGFCAKMAASDYVHTHVCKNGMTVLNALCERFELHNYNAGIHYLLSYDSGERTSPLQDLGATAKKGVSIRFKPDPTMITHTVFNAPALQKWFSTIPITTSNVNIEWNDHRSVDAR